MRPAALWLAVAVAAIALACRVGGVSQGPAALIFGATAVAGTAVYRQATGGCWAACNTGWVCNPDSGLCEPAARQPERRLLRRAPPTPAPPDAGPDASSPL